MIPFWHYMFSIKLAENKKTAQRHYGQVLQKG